MTKVKTYFVTTLVIAGLLALASVVFNQTNNGQPRKNRDDGTATVTVMWTPSPRATGVRIQVWVNGIKQLGDFGTVYQTAPFHRAYAVLKGQRIEVRGILGAGPTAFLSCSISMKGSEVVSDPVPKAIEGSATNCWAVMP